MPIRAAKMVTLNQSVARLAAERPSYATAPQADDINAAKAAQVTAKLNVATQIAAQGPAQQVAQRAAAARKARAAQAAQAVAKRAQQQAAQASQQQVQQSAQHTTSPAPTGSPEQIAQALLSQCGWSSNQMSCLQSLWQREGGCEVTAHNAGSGAYGIPHALPGSKMASAGADRRTNAATQVKWGVEYIKEIYGFPCTAWAHEETDGWY